MNQARLRPLAEHDLVRQTRYYQSTADAEVAERFFNAAIEALGMIETMPDVVSLRLGELADIPGLRSFRITGFPHGWFYFTGENHVDVVRLLSYAQDIPSLLADTDERPPTDQASGD